MIRALNESLSPSSPLHDPDQVSEAQALEPSILLLDLKRPPEPCTSLTTQGPRGEADERSKPGRARLQGVGLSGWLLEYDCIYHFGDPSEKEGQGPDDGRDQSEGLSHHHQVEVVATRSSLDRFGMEEKEKLRGPKSSSEGQDLYAEEMEEEEDWSQADDSSSQQSTSNNLSNLDLRLTRWYLVDQLRVEEGEANLTQSNDPGRKRRTTGRGNLLHLDLLAFSQPIQGEKEEEEEKRYEDQVGKIYQSRVDSIPRFVRQTSAGKVAKNRDDLGPNLYEWAKCLNVVRQSSIVNLSRVAL
ncbi:hypothetical protein IE53DRAFT_58097 [Violaceomyces palustris]|uniref:Uncharacterized protein n=1 Tax=Violaceomyces palustris TaxID=1673888 RepID=A0ACD0NZJ3_9BASI|nr:hypothetical protein IE53DRAFT_58097 [Violaceomyces palustris]